jgi:hypothetical protein
VRLAKEQKEFLKTLIEEPPAEEKKDKEEE